MNPFSLPGAQYYCAPPVTGKPVQSFVQLQRNLLNGTRLISEGSAFFSEYRASALADVERSIFLSASHYRRALDLMIPSSSHWAHVTLYYGTWYAARALLGMFGCVVNGRNIVHVERSSPGTQLLKVQAIGTRSGQYVVIGSGSHRRFWEIFYQAVNSISPFVQSRADQAALSPIAGDSNWLIDQRNKVNYETERAIIANFDFAKSFTSNNFPASLPGELATQYSVCESFLRVAYSFASQFGLQTDALDMFAPHADINSKVSDLVYHSSIPKWSIQARKQSVFTIP